MVGIVIIERVPLLPPDPYVLELKEEADLVGHVPPDVKTGTHRGIRTLVIPLAELPRPEKPEARVPAFEAGPDLRSDLKTLNPFRAGIQVSS